MHEGGRSRGIRVAVRVRPVTEVDASSDCDRLLASSERKEVLLQDLTDQKKAKRFVFDSVFGTNASQEEVYQGAGIHELVEAAVNGYHSTVFAYGQTGSGKTYTMEGIKYTATAPSATAQFKRGGPAGPNIAADFESTPEGRIGVIPRAVDDLFQCIDRNSQAKRFSVKCSFIQIYKEQVYDLLNPMSLNTPGGGNKSKELAGFGVGKRNMCTGPPGFSGALRMRWSKTEDFYLENLFKCECQSADELLNSFRNGITNKIMASHKLNAASSRSHCLFTIYIESSPMASPNEVISSRLTLVDLAGSERSSATGATEGKIRDEGIAINKSLFMLRHVITTLTSQAEGGLKDAHIPYRDSKLTSLLKNSLGGNSLTTMIACLAPLNAHYEENMSTLDYASRANRITNKVAINEDPKSRIIRELRSENAFLRQQLAAVQSAQPGVAAVLSLSGGLTAAAGGQSFCMDTKRGNQPSTGPVSWPGAGGDAAGQLSGMPGGGGQQQEQQQLQGPDLGKQLQEAKAQLEPAEAASLEEMKQRVVQSAQQDVDTLASKLLDAIGLIHKLATVNQQLRQGYEIVNNISEQHRVDNDSLQIENAKLRDQLSIFEGMATLEDQQQQLAMEGAAGPGQQYSSPSSSGGGAGEAAASYYTASSATYIELMELRKENALLHERLGDSMASPGTSVGNGKGPRSASTSRCSPNTASGSNGGRRPVSTGRAQAMGRKIGAPAVPPFTPSHLHAPGSPMHGRQSTARFGKNERTSPHGGAQGSPYSLKGASGSMRSQSFGNMQRPSSQDLAHGAPGGRNLAEINHQVNARALGNNVRISSVGQVNPNAAMRVHERGSVSLSGNFSQGSLAGSLAQDPGPPPGTAPQPYTGPEDDHAGKLQHLMSTRNALARNRILEVPQ